MTIFQCKTKGGRPVRRELDMDAPTAGQYADALAAEFCVTTYELDGAVCTATTPAPQS